MFSRNNGLERNFNDVPPPGGGGGSSYMMCSWQKSSRTRKPIRSRLATGNNAIPERSNREHRRSSGSRRRQLPGFAVRSLSVTKPVVMRSPPQEVCAGEKKSSVEDAGKRPRAAVFRQRLLVKACYYTARVTLPERRHLVQTYTCFGVPSTIALTRFTLGFQGRLERR